MIKEPNYIYNIVTWMYLGQNSRLWIYPRKLGNNQNFGFILQNDTNSMASHPTGKIHKTALYKSIKSMGFPIASLIYRYGWRWR